jgi:hypothetical protein
MRRFLLPCLLLGPCLGQAFGEQPAWLKIHGLAWADYGRIMHVSDSLIEGRGPTNVVNLSGNAVQGMGAQFTFEAELGEHWDGALGFGIQQVTHALGGLKTSNLAISLFKNYLTESRLTWFTGERSEPAFSVTVGNFSYKYNRPVRNLGLYLLRGPVYPGLLMGGFGDFATDTTKSTQLGARIHQAAGGFSHDVIFNNERDVPPTFDWSLAYVAKYRAFGMLELGAGVNFYRLISYESDLTEPGHLDSALLAFQTRKYVEIDSATNDTTFFTNRGTKLMAMFNLDFKPLFGWQERLGANDLVLYGEAAVIGTRNYGKTYGKIAQRIPAMVGFNLPTFGFLDLLSLEVEWYGARYRNDMLRLGVTANAADWTKQDHPIPSSKPVDYSDYGIDDQGRWVNAALDTVYVKGTGEDMENMTTDDWKWSLAAEKSLHSHIRFTAQVANDHYRPRPAATGLIKANGGGKEAFSSGKDWYLMVRMGYYF